MKKEIEIILGHNQFLRIDHKSEDQVRKSKIDKIKIQNLIKYALKIGYDGFMLSTHPEANKIYGNLLIKNPKQKNIHLLVPYANKYNIKLNQKGFLGFGLEILKSLNFKSIFNLFYYFVKLIPISGFVVSVILDLELKKYEKSKIKCLYLHEVVTDILISLNLRSFMDAYLLYCKKNNFEIGLATRNFVILEKFLKKNNILVDRVLTHLNFKGFNMNPSKEAVERKLKTPYIKKIIAMSVFGSGNINNLKKIKYYIKKLKKIDGIIIGTKKQKNIKKNLSFKYV